MGAEEPQFGPGGVFAHGLLRQLPGRSLQELGELAATHRVDRSELLSGLRELEVAGYARQEAGGWILTPRGERFHSW